MARLIDAEHFDVIAYSKDVDGYEDTFDDGVRWLAEQIDKAETVYAITIEDWKFLKRTIQELMRDEVDMGIIAVVRFILDTMSVIDGSLML